MSNEATPHVLVLAAGAASRFGSPKQLVRIGGEALLQRAVARATELAGHAVTVVLGAHAAEITPLLRHSSAAVVINRHWQEGLASSLRLGVAQLSGSTEAVLVTLADQAAITAFDLQRLAAAWRRQPDSAIAASYAGHTGVPAVFPRHAFPLLLALRGDVGARPVLSQLADRVLRVPMPNAAIDIDTPEDLLQLEPGNNPAH
ncbi:MAG TPA: nucleotidyltransferase family protein [Steroidobacteraceae bacterium]|nr:nucleotidyltransferase family protein [Steroidobacteraceae bacterium]